MVVVLYSRIISMDKKITYINWYYCSEECLYYDHGNTIVMVMVMLVAII